MDLGMFLAGPELCLALEQWLSLTILLLGKEQLLVGLEIHILTRNYSRDPVFPYFQSFLSSFL